MGESNENGFFVLGLNIVGGFKGVCLDCDTIGEGFYSSIINKKKVKPPEPVKIQEIKNKSILSYE